MKRKSNFEKKYPLLVKFIHDEVVRQNMLENADLLRKYGLYSTLISTFLGELDKRFDNDTIQFLIKEVVFKLPDELLVSVITAYLNSSESSKCNANFLNYYNKTLHLGEDAIHYIEKKGIVCSRKYLEIPSIIIDDKYRKVKKGNEVFKGEPLDKIFYTLNFDSKKMVIELIESSSFNVLDLIFKNSSSSLKGLLFSFNIVHIKMDMFSVDMLNKLGEDTLRLLIYMLLDMSYVDLCIMHIKTLVANNRIGLLRQLMDTRRIYFIYELTFDEIDHLSDEEILQRLDKGDLNLLKKDE